MAEGIFRVLLKDKNIENIECASFGTATLTGMPATDLAVEAASKYGADIRSHRSRMITEHLIEECDLFVCMTREHSMLLHDYVPFDKIRILAGGIPDPFCGDSEVYAACAKRIYNGLLELLEEVVSK